MEGVVAMFDINFYKDKKVFITGHTGFKGSWLCKILSNAGARVVGYALKPPTEPSLFDIAGIENDISSVIGDIRDRASLKKAFDEAQPEIVLHLAAQPIVRDSYKDPVYTYETNVMGTVNILECVRNSDCVRSFLNVTTDKVYLNREWPWGYRENDELDGYDPYSNSKSCSELVTYSYRHSFFESDTSCAISTARSGNVIGGGDFAENRIIPDCMRSILNDTRILLRNPDSIRPYQHVLECLNGYLLLAMKQYENKHAYEGSYNFGPDESSCITTYELTEIFSRKYESLSGQKLGIDIQGSTGKKLHEANLLKLDCSKAKSVLGWRSEWDIEQALEEVSGWLKVYASNGDIRSYMDEKIASRHW